MKFLFSFLTIIVLCSGCAGPKQARQSAKTLAVFTANVKTNIESFAKSRTTLAQERTAIANNLLASSGRAEMDTSLQVRIWKSAGDGATVGLYEDVISTSDSVAAQLEGLDTMRVFGDEAVKKAKTAVTIPSRNLGETQDGLAILAEKPSLKAQVEFLAGFIKDVKTKIDESSKEAAAENKKGMDAANKKANEAATAANKLDEQIKAKEDNRK